MKRSILVLNGPNLNLLGSREPEVYGASNLETVKTKCMSLAKELGFEIDFFQSNHEGEIIDYIQKAVQLHDGIIINPAAYTHTSIAIMDALLAVKLPVIEVHITNIFKRESFRHHSYISLAADGVICGLGIKGYEFALKAIVEIINTNGEKA